MLIRIGLATVATFLVFRGWNAYGDPRPWEHQSSGVMTVMSFLNTTKYPPSLSFLTMALGPTLLLLAVIDERIPGGYVPRASSEGFPSSTTSCISR